MMAAHDRPRAVPHFGSATGTPSLSQVLSAMALIFWICGPGTLGSDASGPLRSSCLTLPGSAVSAWLTARIPLATIIQPIALYVMAALLVGLDHRIHSLRPGTARRCICSNHSANVIVS